MKKDKEPEQYNKEFKEYMRSKVYSTSTTTHIPNLKKNPIKVYLIGSLKNREIVKIGNGIRDLGFECFDDWSAPGPNADDYWRDFEKARGNSYIEALNKPAAKHIFEFDKTNIDNSNVGVLIMPCGKSGFLELGYMIGQGKKCFILMDEQERWDIMMQFADKVFFRLEDLMGELKNEITHL